MKNNKVHLTCSFSSFTKCVYFSAQFFGNLILLWLLQSPSLPLYKHRLSICGWFVFTHNQVYLPVFLPATRLDLKIITRMKHFLSKRWSYTVFLSTHNLQYDINHVQVSPIYIGNSFMPWKLFVNQKLFSHYFKCKSHWLLHGSQKKSPIIC